MINECGIIMGGDYVLVGVEVLRMPKMDEWEESYGSKWGCYLAAISE
jgi:hypothetical protein